MNDDISQQSFTFFKNEYMNFAEQFDDLTWSPHNKDWMKFREIVARIKKELLK